LNQFGEVFRNLDWSVITDILIAIIPALICITFHELSHGFVAYKLGDDTAKSMGRLTLNPIKHIDKMGLLMMIAFRFGWAKPVPVNMRNFKHPKRGMAITALAGPVSNLVLSAFFLFFLGFLYRPLTNAGTFGHVMIEMLDVTAYLSIALAIFNLLPIPPLDGSKVLFSVLPNKTYFKLMRYEQYGMILLMAFIWLTRTIGSPLSGATVTVYRGMCNIAEWSFSLYGKLM